MSKFKCKECGQETFWSMKDVTEKGTPVCPECDIDMELVEPRCPKCKEEISFLKYSSIKREIGDYDLEERFNEDDPMVQNKDTITFHCPECREQLTDNEDDAIEILKGE